jgi:hypothetical protein
MCPVAKSNALVRHILDQASLRRYESHQTTTTAILRRSAGPWSAMRASAGYDDADCGSLVPLLLRRGSPRRPCGDDVAAQSGSRLRIVGCRLEARVRSSSARHARSGTAQPKAKGCSTPEQARAADSDGEPPHSTRAAPEPRRDGLAAAAFRGLCVPTVCVGKAGRIPPLSARRLFPAIFCKLVAQKSNQVAVVGENMRLGRRR